MKVVILGAGRTGIELARLLCKEGHTVSLVDKNRDAFKRLEEDLPVMRVGGLGIDEDILKRAGIEGAELFVAVSGGDNTNVMASQMAKKVFKVKRVICRIVDPRREKAYRKLGLETFPSTTLTAGILFKTVLDRKPNVDDILQALGEE